eukprot:CAMPEP_0181475590 /NCGR_PEP_ID=MMETSP1110-20121109/41265_1 /TAXON_ID=174948 /ORGANISM="Symbiodinium sp., Strain CCMP421" /LENGTH=112 /DNA_ID=CAMNT_0023600837 /DNA_START=43 /DNA_END=382 /DNA_ORIENTATION=+
MGASESSTPPDHATVDRVVKMATKDAVEKATVNQLWEKWEKDAESKGEQLPDLFLCGGHGLDSGMGEHGLHAGSRVRQSSTRMTQASCGRRTWMSGSMKDAGVSSTTGRGRR